MKRATYYSILGLDPNAGKAEIRSSFRRLALRYHPDRNPARTNAHAAFIAVHHAYEVLIDETTRRQYDAYLAHTAGRAAPAPRRSRRQDPRVLETLSVFNSALWDLEDLLKQIDNENMMAAAPGRITLYDYVLNLLGFLEHSILNEGDRFSNFAGKQGKSRLHIDNFFYLLRMEIDKYLRGLYEGTDDGSVSLVRVVSAETELINAIAEIRRHI